MPDLLDAVPDNARREDLRKFRELEGQVLTSQELRARIRGVRGQVGIFKPAGSVAALWIRQTRRSPYPDKEPQVHHDGSWTYYYAAQGEGEQVDLGRDSNRSLEYCRTHSLPVGVMREVQNPGGKRAYRVHGLARVERREGRYFVMRGEPIDETNTPALESIQTIFIPFEEGTPATAESVRVVRDRRFGALIHMIYGEKCALCTLGYRVRGRAVGLEAAHIIPVGERGRIDDLRNGVLLCQNHHVLYDAYAWAFDRDFRVRVAPDASFRTSAMANHVLLFEGKRLPILPASAENYPAGAAIDWRLERFDQHWSR